MTNQERIEKYKKEHCSKCKNKEKFDCEIRVFKANCMQRRCDECKHYDYCFRYRPRKDVKANAKRKTK